MQTAKNLDQFEDSVFIILGNWGDYTPYRYIPLRLQQIARPLVKRSLLLQKNSPQTHTTTKEGWAAASSPQTL